MYQTFVGSSSWNYQIALFAKFKHDLNRKQKDFRYKIGELIDDKEETYRKTEKIYSIKDTKKMAQKWYRYDTDIAEKQKSDWQILITE